MVNTDVTEQTGKKVPKLLKTNHRMLNPISPPGVYIADPEARQMPDGRVYVYGSRDEPTNVWCSHTYDVLSTSDLINWMWNSFLRYKRYRETSRLYRPVALCSGLYLSQRQILFILLPDE